MNKLSSLVGGVVGKKQQYDEIQEATANRSSGEREALKSSHVSFQDGDTDDLNGTRNSSRAQHGHWFVWVAVIGFVVAVGAGARAFHEKITQDDNKSREDLFYRHWNANASKVPPGTPAYRPCRVRASSKVHVIQTSLGEPDLHWSPVSCASASTISVPAVVGDAASAVMPDATLQVNFRHGPTFEEAKPPILGFGGAFTEASALNYKSLTAQGQTAVVDLLFGQNGLGYSMGRVHMNSCDFSVESYSFDTTDGDFQLDHFDHEVTHDVESGMVDMMLAATAAAERDGEPGMRIFSSPWSPPAWMKAPTWKDAKGALHAENMTFSAGWSCLRDGVGPTSKYAQTWALYFSKFIHAYADLGLNLWGVSVQNEPEFPAPWEACSYTPESQGQFLANHLGPTLRENHPDVKILMFDHNKDHAPKWARTILPEKNPAHEFVDGTAVHWYAGGMDRLLDGAVGSPNMHRLQSDLTKMKVKDDHIILGSEACHCPSTGYAGGDLTVAWARAQRYAHTILADLSAGSNGWVEWNLILDAIGGPNHLGNECDAPLLAVPYRAKGADGVPKQEWFEKVGYPFGTVHGDQRTREELHALGVPAEYLDMGIVVQPMYYFMGHISRHVRPGSRVVNGLADGSTHPQTTGQAPARAFRLAGQTVAGGGINDLARNGVELTMWPCEGSTRQQFFWNQTSDHLQVNGHDWLGEPTISCVAKTVDQSFLGLTLSACDKTAGTFGTRYVATSNSGQVNIFLKSNVRKCLIVKPLDNAGGAYGPRGGAQVTYGNCSDKGAAWTINEETGEFISEIFNQDGGDVCMTTGWPFLQMSAFDTPSDKTVVVLNEGGESANFILRDDTTVIMTAHIPPHSIQTISYM